MLRFLKNNLKKLTWFLVGLVGMFLLALGLHFITSVSVVGSSHHQSSLHAYTPRNHSENSYWSVGVTRDSDHLPTFNGSWVEKFQ
uniref:Uncharacterized protein n=1 Tax=Tolypothrix bouteillei VB521301 TaxID=1479485 RepID=A0A0C1N7P5_9CYAN